MARLNKNYPPKFGKRELSKATQKVKSRPI